MSFRKPRAPIRRNMLHVFHGPARASRFHNNRFRLGPTRGQISALGARRRRRANNMRIPVELKFYDTFLTAATMAATTAADAGEDNPTSTSMITTPVVGDGEQNRDGKHMIVKSVHIIGNVAYPVATNVTAANAPMTGYVALVQDTNTQGAQLNSEDVFKNIPTSAVNQNDHMRNLLFGKRFKVLKMFKFNIVPSSMWDGTNTEVFGAKRRFEWWIPNLNMHVNFNAGTTADVANVVDNSLQMISFCSANSGQETGTLSYSARIRFVG